MYNKDTHTSPSPPPTQPTLPLPQAHFIWYCAWLSLPSAAYAYAHPATTHLALIPASVFATSLLYWRNPLRESWRRKFDMAIVYSGVSYNSYYAYRYTSPLQFQYYALLIAASLGCYITSNYLLKYGRVWPATYAHASIHLFANIANLVLYSGMDYEFHNIKL